MKIKGEVRKRFLSFLLVLSMLCTNLTDFATTISAKADSNSDGPEVSVTVSGGGRSFNVTSGEKAVFPYGTTLNMELSGLSDGDISFHVQAPGEDDELLDTGKVYEVGTYYFGYEFEPDDNDDEKYIEANLCYRFEIVRAKLSAPANLGWSNGSTVVFDAVTTDVDGIAVSGQPDYSVSLYKGDTVVSSQKVSGSDALEVNFSEAMLGAGAGDYVFSVSAVVPADDDTFAGRYENSEESSKSAAAKVVNVNLLSGNGISSATVAGDSSSSFLVIPGNSSLSSKTISAVPESGWEFGEWRTDAPITFEHSTNANTTITVSSGSTDTMDITATAKESNAPTITAFVADNGTLKATAEDTQSGIVSYFFAAKETAGADDVLWGTNYSDTPTLTEKEFTMIPTASGTYYFFVMDASGNIARSESGISVSKIVLKDYFENSVKTAEKVEAYIGAGTYELPDLSDEEGSTVHRKGYSFGGWFDNDTFTGTAVSSVSSNPGTDKTYYAKWIKEDTAFDEEQGDLSVTYNGEDRMLTSAVTDTSADVSYKLYRFDEEQSKYVFVENADDGKFYKRNVKDSGKYRIDAIVTAIGEDGSVDEETLTGTPFTVTIEKAELKAVADNVTVVYKDAAPEKYTFTYVGLLGDDRDDIEKAEITAVSNLNSGYQAGDPCKDGGYPIVFTGSFSSDNYTITKESGVLTVEPKDVNDADTDVTAVLSETEFTYSGSPIVPTVSVEDDEVIDNDQYDITYDDDLTDAPVAAGSHKVVLVFKNNYKGTLELPYTIGAKSFTAETIIEEWEYGETAKTPSVSDLPADISNPTVNYYYLTGEVAEVTEATAGSLVVPENAGTYTVYAVIEDPAGNYEKTIAEPVTFNIYPRTIYLVAEDEEWEYDGNPHTYHEYHFEDKNHTKIPESDVFVLNKESFRSITVTGTVTNVILDAEGNNIGVPNVPSYVLSDATNKDNYNIIPVEGNLKVTPQELLCPANLEWDFEHPGTATWVAITKQNLIVNYEVSLYEVTSTGSKLVDTVTTADTSIAFREKIHEQIDGDEAKSFYFTVKTIPADSTDAEKKVKNDYTESNVSEPSDSIHTVTISLTKKICDESTKEAQEGFASITFKDADVQSAGKITLIPGEHVNIVAIAEDGYDIGFGYDDHTGHYWNHMVHPTTYAYQNYFDASYNSVPNGVEATITVKRNLDRALSDVSFTAGVNDEGPRCYDFTKANADDYSGVVVTATLRDTIGLKEWSIQKVSRYVSGKDANGQDIISYHVESNYAHSNLLEEYGEYPKETSIEVKISEPGLYRLAYDDIAPDHTYTYLSDSYFNVYKVEFEKGDTDDEVHVMNPIYKLENTNIPLPLCAFTKDHYSFKNWSGANTGISTDGALYKANLSDTLVAQWTNDQYRYFVDYFYMSDEGTYAEEPDLTDEFVGGAGTTVKSSDLKIQKARTNYSLDETKNASIVLTADDMRLGVYYSKGQYSINYRYTLPGEAEPTVVTDKFYYGQAVTEHEKPVLDGYTFIGWNFVGFGAAPETMPAQNIEATGRFVPAKTTYTVVRHLQALGQGTTHSEVYESNTELAPTLVKNGTQDDELHAYRELPENAGVTDVAADVVDGFTLRGIVINNTADMGEALPDEDVLKADTASGVISASQPLYVHYYYDRNEYSFALEVWKDNREEPGNLIYQNSVIKQYGEDIGDEAAAFADNEYYTSLPGFDMPSGYIFASYTDYSTGKKPDYMPAGSVTVTRDVIPAEKVAYKINVYFEKDAIDEYKLMTTLNYSSLEGHKVQMVDSIPAEKAADTDYVTFDSLKAPLNNGNYFTHVFLEDRSLEEGSASAETPLILNVYYERITTDIKVQYYYGNSRVNGNKLITEFILRGKWGSTYTFDPIALFDANTSASWLSGSSVYKTPALVSNPSTVVVNDITTKEGATVPALEYDFRENSYLVSYRCAYDYFDANDIRQRTWPNYTFTTVGSAENTRKLNYKTSAVPSAGIGDLIQCYFGVTTDSSNYCQIYYNEITEKEDYYLDVRIRKNTLNDKEDPDWYLTKYPNISLKTYPDYAGEKFIPVIYEGMGGAYPYPVRIINKCAVVTGSKTDAGAGLTNYPAAAAKTRSYTYPVDHKDEVLHAGFTHLEGDYYYYDGSCGQATGAYGSEKYVYLVLGNDPFLQGAYVSVSRNSSTEEGKQAVRYLDEYKDIHAEEAARYELDKSASAGYLYNSSFGGAYIYGDNSYLTYTYSYHSDCQLRYNYNGNTCQNAVHQYVYGTRLTKEKINATDKCNHSITSIPEGYEIVWYMNPERTEPIPEEGFLLTESKTLYGKMEKILIQNMEYVYYELADPIEVDGVDQKYVTSKNLDAIKTALAAQGKALDEDTSEEDTTVYSYEGAVVMVAKKRPTESFTELYLSMKAEGKDYEEAYGKEGFYYDETNTDNRSYGYVNTTPLNLKVYFARDKYQVEIHPHIAETDNPEYKQFSIDQHVLLETPVKPGYTFDGWEWKSAVDSTAYTPTYEADGVTFKMPAKNLIAHAKWNAAEFPQDVMHYFQTAALSFDTSFAENISGTEDTTKTAKFGDVVFDAGVTVYTSGEDSVSAVVVETEDIVYYFAAGTIKDDVVILQESDLVAAKTQVNSTSGEDQNAEFGSLSGFTLFTYNYTTVKTATSMVTKKTGESFVAEYGMELEYYYLRSADQHVRTRAVSMDGGSVGMTLTGGGESFLGDKVTVSAHMLDGYNFVGWFAAEDLLADYPGEDGLKELNSYALIDSYAQKIEDGIIVPIETEEDYLFTVTESVDLIAVSMASAIVAPNIVINGKTDYVFGYADSSDNMLIAVATMDQSNPEAGKTKVTGYTWFIQDGNGEWIDLEEENSAYSIPTGLDAGTYTYKCVVTYERTDTGRKASAEVEKTITVGQAVMNVTSTAYSGVFDNEEHHITLSVQKPGSAEDYIIYYADEPITEENFASVEKTTELPTYKDVNNDGTNACAHTTYYYIKDLTGNYKDYAGSQIVNITPKQISIKALNATFTKMYDASDKVLGMPTEENTDMYNLSHGRDVLYALSGFVDSDTDQGSYILACDATYNDAHVKKAKSFTIQDLYLVANTNGVKTYNYSFPAATSLTFSGNITPRPLSVAWDEQTEFVYNGQPQAPNAHLALTQAHEIPAQDKDYFELTVSGKQTNIGSYTAGAIATVKAGGTFEPSDYTFDNMNKNYSIINRGITIVPNETIVTYDGQPHTIMPTTQAGGGGMMDTIKNYKVYITGSDPLTEDTVVEDYKLTMSPVVYHTEANEDGYLDMVFKNAVITNAQGRDLTENYTITYGTGTLIINRAPLKFNGITAEEKTYDGTTAATIHVGDGDSEIVYETLYSKDGKTDDVALDASKITGAYESAAVGTSTVELTIPEDALTGEDAANYRLDLANSQKTATGLITASTIKVVPDAKTVVYGESVTFTSTFSGIFKNDGSEGQIGDIETEGSVSYLIDVGQDGLHDWVEYVPGEIGVGVYPIMVNTTALTTHDHTFSAVTEETSLLTVTKRPVALVALDILVSKDYDATIAVKESIVKGTHYAFGKVTKDDEEVEASGVLAKDAEDFDLASKNVAYDVKDVTAQYVKLTDAVVNNDNYQLSSASADIPGEILPIALTLSADETTITYGELAPKDCCTVTGSGFVSYTKDGETVTETAADLPGTICYKLATYDASNVNKRNAGTYEDEITPYILLADGSEVGDGELCGNYVVSYVKNNLIVEKAVLTLTADDKTLYYKVGNTVGDETGLLPDYTYQLSDWIYEEDAADYDFDAIVLPRTETGLAGGTPIKLTTVPGTYPIKIPVDNDEDKNVSGVNLLSARDNYIFKAEFGTLTVIKHNLTINGAVTIPNKVYDGNTTLHLNDESELGGLDDLVYDELAEEDKADRGILVDIEKSANKYPDKNVGTYNTDWVLDIALNDYLAARYELDTENSCVTASSSILKRPVQIKAVDKEIVYGSPVPALVDYAIEEVKKPDAEDENLVEGESLSTDYTFTMPTSYSCEYSAESGSYTEVGSYELVPVGVDAQNYDVTALTTGRLTVLPAQLTTPSPVWSDDNIGTITWEPSVKIGDVSCAGYIVELYKEGQAEAVSVVGTEEEPYAYAQKDFADTIRSNGGGVYSVKVKAIAKTENNESKKNVKDSNYGTSDVIYATTVTPVFAGDTEGAGDKIDSKDPIYVNESLGSYTLIAGEAAVPVSALLQNATGYTVEILGDTGLGVSQGNIVEKADKSGEYTGATVFVESTAQPAAATTLTIKLTARLATIDGTFTITYVGEETSLTYGYTDSEAPTLTANVQPKDTDNVSADEYEYLYEWYIKYSNTGDYVLVQSGELEDLLFPSRDQDNDLMPAKTHRVKCYVTAVRKDNGRESERLELKDAAKLANKYIDVRVKKGTYNPACTFGGAGNSWVYGQERKLPEINGLVEEVQDAEVTYEFSADGTTWTKDMFTDVGTYFVRATIAETDNYDKKTTEPIEYKITRAKLDAPENLEMTKSSTAPYGRYAWDPVAGPKENNNAGSVSASDIKVKYQVSLYKKENDNKTIIKTVTITETEYDFTNQIVEAGTYGVDVTALVDEKRDGQDVLNCEDSEMAEMESFITIGAAVSSNNADTDDFTKVYDGTALTMTVTYSDGHGEPTYEWIKNGTEVVGTDDHYSITYVEENATFTCRVTSANGLDVVYTKPVAATIIPRPITVTTASDSKTYDGTPLTNTDYEIAYTGDSSKTGIAAGDTEEISVNGSITYVTENATGNNPYSGLVIKRSGKTVYAEGAEKNNYVVTGALGTLKIEKHTLAIKATAKTDYVYDGTEKTSNAFTTEGLQNGDKVIASSLVFDGSITNAGTVTNTPAAVSETAVVVKDSEELNDLTANYTIQYVGADLTVQPRPIEITTASAEKDYDGEALTKKEYSITDGSLADNEKITEIIFSGTQTNAGESDNTVSSIVIRKENGAGEVSTSNYDISYVKGTLKVKQIERVLHAEDLTVYYDGQSHTITATIDSAKASDNVDLIYTVEDETFSGAVERGAYEITIKAPETVNYAEKSVTVKLTIIRQITLTANSDQKEYDGTPLVNNGYVVSFTNGALTGAPLAAGDAITDGSVTVTGSQTNKGSSSNVIDISAIEITNAGEDVTEFYEFTTENGMLSVGQKTLVLTAKNAEKTYDGTPLVCGLFTQTGKAESDVITLSMTAGSTITNVGSKENVIDESTIVIMRGAENVTDSYSIQCNPGTLTVSKKALLIKATEKTYTYDGTEKTWSGADAFTAEGLENGDLVDAESLVFSGKRTNAGETSNMPSAAKITDKNGDGNLTDNYAISYEAAALIIEPKELTEDDLVLSSSEFPYSGNEVGPTITVEVDLDGSGDHETTLTKSVDYVISEDSTAKKQTKATAVGTYVVEVTGQGNYIGTVSKIYKITDNNPADIADASGNDLDDGGEYNYCKSFEFSVDDPNLLSVVILANGEDVTPTPVIKNGKPTYSINGSGDDPDVPVVYTITVTDVKEKNGNTVTATNSQTFTVNLYPDHVFTQYETDHTKHPDGLVLVAPCDHNCGAKDYIVKPQGSVDWDYDYTYSTEDGIQSGTINRGERETYAVVRLLDQNHNVIAEQLVNCDDTCGISGTQHAAVVPYIFETMGMNGEAEKIPYYDEHGNVCNYSIEVKPVHYDEATGNYSVISVYTTSVEDPSLLTNLVHIRYMPGVFDVPWKVVLKNLPTETDAEGNTVVIHPTSIHVKVLYAESPDAEDGDYAIITQHLSASSKGVACSGEPGENGTYVFEGSYPCWEYIGGTHDTYYHRIQIVGYDFDGDYYDISGKGYKSPCDNDHKNHTITYDPHKDAATGTILYELSGLMPTLIFDRNDGSGKVHKIIWKGIGVFDNEAEVTAEEIAAVGKPKRKGYTFLGWYTQKKGGTLVSGPVLLSDESVTVYAHWKKNETDSPSKDPSGDDPSGDNPSGDKPSGGDTTPPAPNPGTDTPNTPVGPDKTVKPPVKPGSNPPGAGSDDVNPDGTDGSDITDTDDAGEDENTVEPGSDGTPEDDGNPLGNLELIVKNERQDDPISTTPDKPEKSDDKSEPDESLIEIELIDRQELIDQVLTEDEKTAIKDGGKMIIRLLVNDHRRTKPGETEDPKLHKFMKNLENTKGQKAVFKTYINLKLEKQLNGGDWERILATGQKVMVSLTLPEDIRGDYKEFYLIRKTADGYEIIDNLEKDVLGVIRFMTDDFESDYAIVVLEDENTVCYWHWLIALISLIYLVALLLTLKKKKKEDDIEISAEVADEELAKQAKKSRNRRWILLIPYAAGLIVITYFGHCNLELPFDIISVILVGGTDYGTYRHKFKELNKKGQ